MLGEISATRRACLARRRPGIREVRIKLWRGSYDNLQPRRFAPAVPDQRQMRLNQHDDELVLDLPAGSEAVVPQQPTDRRGLGAIHPDRGVAGR
jgi:hypothetical protein